MKEWIFCQTTALILGFLTDCILGDPYFLPHPVVWIGKLISYLDQKLRRGEKNPEDLYRGILMALVVILISVSVPLGTVFLTWQIHHGLYLTVETVMCWQIIAPCQLWRESRKVEKAMEAGDVEKARIAVSMIVGRDTNVLDEDGILRAAVETVAENTSDGVIAPMLYLLFGGAVGGFFYKAVNTLDSMVGYRNEKYLYFGRASAKMDDFVNFIPARVSAWLMLCGGWFLKLSEKNIYSFSRGLRIYVRDRYRHASPNSGQTEAVCAGLLGIRLAGDIIYGGVLHRKEFIGDDVRPIVTKDITRSGRLMYSAAILFLLFIIILRIGWYLCL